MQLKGQGREVVSMQPRKVYGRVELKLRTFILNPLNAELNPICHSLALLEAHH